MPSKFDKRNVEISYSLVLQIIKRQLYAHYFNEILVINTSKIFRTCENLQFFIARPTNFQIDFTFVDL